MKSVIVVGGLNLDVCGMPDRALVPHDSNIGTVVLRAGGVGHNIAARLAEKGVPVELVAALGDDGAAGMLSARCAEEKIGLRYALRLHGASCCYLSLHEADGDMAAAVNAMKLMDAFTPDRLPMDAINASSLCVLDTNLPAETLERLAACATVPLLADPVLAAERGLLGPLHDLQPDGGDGVLLHLGRIIVEVLEALGVRDKQLVRVHIGDALIIAQQTAHHVGDEGQTQLVILRRSRQARCASAAGLRSLARRSY